MTYGYKSRETALAFHPALLLPEIRLRLLIQLLLAPLSFPVLYPRKLPGKLLVVQQLALPLWAGAERGA